MTRAFRPASTTGPLETAEGSVGIRPGGSEGAANAAGAAGVQAPIRLAVRPPLTTDGMLAPVAMKALLEGVTTDKAPYTRSGELWDTFVHEDEFVRVLTLRRMGDRLRHDSRLQYDKDDTSDRWRDPDAPRFVPPAHHPAGDPRRALIALALAEADAEGLVWTPTLDALDATDIWGTFIHEQDYQRTDEQEPLPTPEERLQALVPWLGAHSEVVLLRPLGTMGGPALRRAIAAHAAGLTEAEVEALGLTDASLDPVLARNAALPPATREAAMRRLAAQVIEQGDYWRSSDDKAYEARCALRTIAGAEGLPKDVRSHMLTLAPNRAPRSVARLLLEAPSLDADDITGVVECLAHATPLNDGSELDAAAADLARALSLPTTPPALLERLLVPSRTTRPAAGDEACETDARDGGFDDWDHAEGAAEAILDRPPTRPAAVEASRSGRYASPKPFWRRQLKAPNGEALAWRVAVGAQTPASTLQHLLTHFQECDDVAFWLVRAPNVTLAQVRTCVQMWPGDKDLQSLIAKEHPAMLADPVIAADVFGTRSPAVAADIFRHAAEQLPADAYRRLFRLAMRHSLDDVLRALERTGFPQGTGLEAEDFLPFMQKGGTTSERAMPYLQHLPVPRAKGTRKRAP